MPQQSSPEVRKAVKLVRSAAAKKFGKDWSLIISNDGGLQIEGRHVSGNIVQSVVWRDGKMENRTLVARK